MKKRKLLILIIFLSLLTSCQKLNIDISKESDEIVYVPKEKDIVTSSFDRPFEKGSKVKVNKYNKFTKKKDPVILKVNYVKRASDDDLKTYKDLYNENIDKNKKHIYKLNYDLSLINYKTGDLGDDASLDISFIDKNKSKIDTKVYFLMKSKSLKEGETGNVSLLFSTNETEEDFYIVFNDEAYFKVGA